MNKNTKQARMKGWASKKDMQNKGVEVWKGRRVDSGFPCKLPATKRLSKHVYPKKREVQSA